MVIGSPAAALRRTTKSAAANRIRADPRVLDESQFAMGDLFAKRPFLDDDV
jgi:hypothetical protein